MTPWCSLYLPCGTRVAAALGEALTTLGYELFNPFGSLPGKAYPQAVRLFVAPARGGWTRVIGAPDPALLAPLSRLAQCLLAELDGADAHIEAYADGAPATFDAAFPSYADCLNIPQESAAVSGADKLGGVALDALPDDVQALARKVDMKQARSLFERMSARLASKTGGDPAARDLLRQPEWSSAGGVQIASLLACLNVPNWRDPDFVTLRDAYALHERRRRNPKAMLYPGDAEALAAVPDALDYTPVYAEKRMSADDRRRWDTHYREWAGDAYPDPDPLLFQYVPPLREEGGARALDLAAGRGQNGLWLAAQGYVVDLMDISRIALLRAQAEAALRSLRCVNFLQIDLDTVQLEPASYDLVCVIRFLDRKLMPMIRAAVKPGGRVVYQTFNVRYRTFKPEIKPEYLLNLGELAGLFGDWKILRSSELDHVSQVVAIKPEK